MSPFWQAFWGGVLGKIAGAIFVAACVVMWLGPEDWVKWIVSDLPAFFTPAMARWVFFALGAVVILLMVYPLIQRLLPETKKNAYVPLKEAATIAYEEMRGTRAGTIIEGLNPDNVLGYYAHAFFNGKTTLYGNYPPSRKLEAVPNEEYGRCGFSDDQNALRRHGENRNLYENLQIKRFDLDRRIAELKSAAAAPQSEAHDFALANLDEWRNVDSLELWRAGCLWKGFQPHYPIGFEDPAYASYIMLVNAAKAGQLTVTNPGTEVDAWSLVSRSELARFAGTKGDVPEFLMDVVDSIKGGVTQKSDEPAPPTWFELEQRFRELEPPLQFTRIDGQTGAAGEHWRLAGAPSGDAGRRFNAVAAMASTRLFKDFPSEIRRFPELESESDPVIRWYKALQFIADRYEDYRYAEQINDDGSSGGFIYTGSIDQPATASATLCLELASRPREQS